MHKFLSENRGNLYIIREGVMQRNGGGRQLREGYALPDKNNNTTAGVCDISRKNLRPGVAAIRSQSRESRDLERGRLIKIRFLDTKRSMG